MNKIDNLNHFTSTFCLSLLQLFPLRMIPVIHPQRTGINSSTGKRGICSEEANCECTSQKQLEHQDTAAGIKT